MQASCPRTLLKFIELRFCAATPLTYRRNPLRLFSQTGPDKQQLQANQKQSKVLTVPNAISFSRIILTPFIGHFIITKQLAYAVALGTLAGISDSLDGAIARRFPGQQSVVGTYLDPAADKIMVATLVISLTVSDLFPSSLAVLIISRDIVITCVVVRLAYLSLPRPVKLKNLVHARRMPLEMKASNISKFNTTCQLTAIVCSILAPLFSMENFVGLQGLC
ncbi:unnamed protein product [Calicophoron daubneyi]|uniref:cardiolipin synthase (CMP-forming) n=1 Tax=Calicophoron daubneyi TaxID=300641 RepID=A0AAV2T612_CALDB